MNIFQYLIFIGIIYTIVTLLSTILILLATLTLHGLRVDSLGTSYRVVITLCNAIVLYLLLSLVSSLTILADQKNRSMWSFAFFSIVGMLTVLWIGTRNVYEKHKSGDYYGHSSRLRDDLIISLAAPALFIVSVFVPIIASNPITNWLFGAIEWLDQVRILGWLLGLIGILIMIAMLEDAFFAFVSLIFVSIRSVIKRESKSQ
ncbi:MAG: hypothetical protein DMF70_12355 [Acidobacteria bacterium]|nr:MAG: hypothetical protein DMF70_12355 [Acidobacteriota bacterium]